MDFVNKKLSKRLKDDFILLTFLVSHILFTILLVFMQEHFLGLDKYENSIEENFKRSPAFYSIFIIGIGPLMEETIYRLPLKRNKYFVISLLLSIAYLLGLKSLLVIGAMVLYISSLLVLWYKKNDASKVIIGLSILTFAMIHIENYGLKDLTSMQILELLSTFFPQLMLGIIVTAVRLKFSFNYGLIYHILYNGIIVSLVFILNEF